MAEPTVSSTSSPGLSPQSPPADASTRNTWVLVSFTAVTNLTDGVTKVALPLIATSLTDSPALVSGVLLTLTLPWLLVALHVGVLVDRSDRRKLLWLANAMRMTVVLGLFTALVADVVSLPMLYGGGLILGVAEVIALTSAAALVPDAVAPAGRERANTWVTAAETLCNEFAGPFVGGILVAGSASIALGATIGGYALAILVLPFLVGRFRVPRRSGQPELTVNQQIGEGLRFLWNQRLLRMLSLTVTGLITCWAAWFALMPLITTKELGLSADRYGMLVGALGVGGVVGTMSVGLANRLLGRRWVMFGNVFFSASMVAVPALTSNVWAIGAAAFLGGMGGTLWVVNSRSISQTLVGAELMGRYSAAARLFSWGSIPVGAAVSGALAQWLGYRVTFGLFAVATAVVIVPFLRVFTPKALIEVEARIAAR
ncbi:MFS transporter [Streptomyces samsunensis]|uniref:MFS transporter n=1 Tax=Streptomyces malaysiensis TaxID=92644 RepID=A0ABX6WKV0_STRMQ|nr:MULTISPECIES: MFS transporter [Streptomyces]MCC4320362.1 MFS transporter [Streptomyces malaysiensis]MYU10799.1 MFS transporter [Streptomyces sp. SID8361]AUA08267.1 putative multidrug-efflux transporter [Streptomyces sp. M56]MCD9591924.1 MFS transporter [Streptomyces sp. 8ZJF_21]MCM3809453.1 MFS transporter [Streptomyces sp. DR7-3]